MLILGPGSMSRRVSPLAGFQVTIIGRFWVTTEGYSRAECIGCKKAPVFGNPDPRKSSTSHVERQNNLTMRMQMRRLTRSTNAFSKKREKLYAMLALYFGWYNFVRVHQSLRVTPALEAGIADHVWTIKEMMRVLE
jgi:capsule polysaccharide modification protein KpsS